MNKKYITIDYEEYQDLLMVKNKLVELLWKIYKEKEIDKSLKNYILSELQRLEICI